MQLKSPVKLLLAVLLLIGTAVSMWLAANHRQARERRLAGVPESRARLVEMLGSSRRFEGRLLGMGYASFDPARDEKPLPRGRLKKALALVNENRDDSQAERLSNEALVYSFGNDLDAAIQALSLATSSKGAKPWMWSDLAALHLEHFRRNSDPQALLSAVDTLAHMKDSTSFPLEGYFNYALSLEKLALITRARIAWKDYIKRDIGSAWVREARAHLENLDNFDHVAKWERIRGLIENAGARQSRSLVEAAVREFPQFSREYAQADLLGLWGMDQQQNGMMEEQEILSRARLIGQRLAAETGEYMVADAVHVIDRTSILRHHELASLAGYHARYHEALVLYRNGSYRQAEDLFRKAQYGLVKSGSPLSRWALLWVAICQFHQFHYESSAHVLTQLTKSANASRYPALQGSAEWTLGLIRVVVGDPAGALLHYRKALQFFIRAKEKGNQSSLQRLISESTASLGDFPTALANFQQSLQGACYIQDTRKKYSVLSGAADLAEDLDFNEAALDLLDEASGWINNGEPSLQVAYFRRRAILFARAGRAHDAQGAIVTARKLLAEIGDKSILYALLGDLLVVEGDLLSQANKQVALDKLSAAIGNYEDTEYKRQLRQLYFQRGRVEASLQQTNLAEKDFQHAIRLAEEEREITPGDERDTILEGKRRIYDEMARLEIASGKNLEALETLEQARSRVLLDQLVTRNDSSIRMERSMLASWIQQDLPQNTAFVEYRRLGESYFSWIIHGKAVEVVRIAGAASDLESLVRRMCQAGESIDRSASFRAESGQVFDFIIRPLWPHLKSVERIIFIPDGPLYQVPFAALLNPDSGRFLVEDFAVLVTPSITIHRLAARKKSINAISAAPISILAVGAPEFAIQRFPFLTAIHDTESEVREVAGLYPIAQVDLGKAATVARFLKEAPKYQVIHVATHGIIDLKDSSLSLLIMSPEDPEDSGALYAYRIRRLHLDSVRLVVLDVCDSLGGKIGQTEGLYSLASDFLASGAPTVVATLWNLNDKKARGLAKRFHELVRRGSDPAMALRQTQREAIMLGGDPAWAAFEVFGS